MVTETKKKLIKWSLMGATIIFFFFIFYREADQIKISQGAIDTVTLKIIYYNLETGKPLTIIDSTPNIDKRIWVYNQDTSINSISYSIPARLIPYDSVNWGIIKVHLFQERTNLAKFDTTIPIGVPPNHGTKYNPPTTDTFDLPAPIYTPHNIVVHTNVVFKDMTSDSDVKSSEWLIDNQIVKTGKIIMESFHEPGEHAVILKRVSAKSNIVIKPYFFTIKVKPLNLVSRDNDAERIRKFLQKCLSTHYFDDNENEYSSILNNILNHNTNLRCEIYKNNIKIKETTLRLFAHSLTFSNDIREITNVKIIRNAKIIKLLKIEYE